VFGKKCISDVCEIISFQLEHHHLKQELAELAIAINLEAQKAQVQEVQHEK
jgi:hypothetical protein